MHVGIHGAVGREHSFSAWWWRDVWRQTKRQRTNFKPFSTQCSTPTRVTHANGLIQKYECEIGMLLCWQQPARQSTPGIERAAPRRICWHSPHKTVMVVLAWLEAAELQISHRHGAGHTVCCLGFEFLEVNLQNKPSQTDRKSWWLLVLGVKARFTLLWDLSVTESCIGWICRLYISLLLTFEQTGAKC